MNLGFVRLGLALMFVAGIFGASFAHEHENSDSLKKADPHHFPRQESCPKGFFWQTVTNKTPFNVRVFIDGKAFSTEIYALNPNFQATRCFPEGKHEVKIIAFTYEKMPFSRHGRIEVIRAEGEFYYDSSDDYKNKYVVSGFIDIEEKNLNTVALVSFKNVKHNSGIFSLIFLAFFAVGAALLSFIGLFRLSKNHQGN